MNAGLASASVDTSVPSARRATMSCKSLPALVRKQEANDVAG